MRKAPSKTEMVDYMKMGPSFFALFKEQKTGFNGHIYCITGGRRDIALDQIGSFPLVYIGTLGDGTFCGRYDVSRFEISTKYITPDQRTEDIWGKFADPDETVSLDLLSEFRIYQKRIGCVRRNSELSGELFGTKTILEKLRQLYALRLSDLPKDLLTCYIRFYTEGKLANVYPAPKVFDWMGIATEFYPTGLTKYDYTYRRDIREEVQRLYPLLEKHLLSATL